MKYNSKYNVYVSKDGVVCKLVGRWRDNTKHLEPASVHDNHGYCKITGKHWSRPLHCIVWETFVGEIPEGMQINHIDGNKHNNCLENLELVTPHENMVHAWKTGLCKSRKGIKTNKPSWNSGLKGAALKKHYPNGFSNQFGKEFM